jgi:phage terminase small subunit
MKKPPTAVEPPPPIPPPSHLSDKSKELWRSVVPRRARSPERLTLLQVALEALDRADSAAEVIRTEGMTVKTATTGVTHAHVAVKIERESRGLFLRAWDQLGFEWWSPIDGKID